MPSLTTITQMLTPLLTLQTTPGQNQLIPEHVIALRQGYTMLNTLVSQLKSLRINNPSTKALALDLQTALSINQNPLLSDRQKEAQLARMMNQTLDDLNALAAEPSMPTKRQASLATVISQFRQLTVTAQLDARGN